MVKQVWKRMLAFVLAFAMVICDAGLSNLVYAAEDETEAAETVEAATVAASATADEESDAVETVEAVSLTASTTDDAESYLKKQLTAAWDAGLSYVELDEDYEVTPELVDEVYEDYLTYEYKYFYVYEGYRTTGYDNDGDSETDVVITVWITYGLDDGFYGTDKDGSKTTDSDGDSVYVTSDLTAKQLAAIASKQEELEDAIAEIVDGVDSDWTDVEKVLYLNDYLAETCQYDQDAYEQNNTTERMTFTIYGALINNLCVCQGYAHAFVVLARELGLEAELVDSASLGHQWNAVKVDGSWYLLDVTWDDPVKTTRVSNSDGQINDTIGKISHTYFLKSLSYFRSGTDHTTHLDKDDWVFTGGLTKSDITGSSYDSYFWDEVRTPFIYDSEKGVWYAMVTVSDDDATSLDDLDPTGSVYAYTFSSNGKTITYNQTLLFTVEDTWTNGNQGTLKMGLYGLDYHDGALYYTTTDAVYVYDIDTKTSSYYSGLTDAQLDMGDIYGMKIAEDGTLYVQLSESYNDVGSIVTLCNVESSTDIADCTITLSKTSYDYDGTDKKPTVTVKKGTTVLKEGTAYRVEYPDDVENAGTKTITITGIGTYHGTVTKTYTIEKVNLSSADVSGMTSSLKLVYGETSTPYKTYNGTHDLTTSKNKSGDESIVTITNGTIKAVGVGETVIYYYIGDEENYNYIEMPVVVSRADQTISIVGVNSITYGSTAAVTASTTGDGAISFSSSNKSVAYVQTQSDGTYKLITAGAGTATITVTAAQTEHYNKATKTFTVTVKQASQSLSVKTKGSTTLYAGETTTWKYVSSGDGTVKYTSSDTSVATVSSSGVVTAKAAGEVTITIVAQASTNYKKSSSVTVKMLIYPAATSSVSLSSTSSGVKITWKKVAGADGYYIYRNNSSKPFAQVKSGSTVTYTDTSSKTNGTKYTYKVVAYLNYSSSVVLGKASSSKSITYKYLAKASISSLTNVASGVTVKWSKVTGASGYYIYRGSTQMKKITSGSTTSWTDTSAKNGTSYTYYVVPYSGTYKGAKSSGVKTVRLTVPTLSSVKNTASKTMKVTYKSNSKATGYKIEYSTSKKFTSSTTKTVTVKGSSTLSKKITSLKLSKTYYVRVRAYKTVSGKTYYSAYSSTKSIKISK